MQAPPALAAAAAPLAAAGRQHDPGLRFALSETLVWSVYRQLGVEFTYQEKKKPQFQVRAARRA